MGKDLNRSAHAADIPDQHHVLRYCRPRQVDNGTITMSAFLLRSSEEFISVNWMEYFGVDITADIQVEKVREDMGESLTLSASGRFAKINVGDLKKRIESAEVKHQPEPENPSHAGIYIPEKDGRNAAFALADLVAPGGVFPGKV